MTAGKDEQSSHVAECAAPKPPRPGWSCRPASRTVLGLSPRVFSVVYPEPQRFPRGSPLTAAVVPLSHGRRPSLVPLLLRLSSMGASVVVQGVSMDPRRHVVSSASSSQVRGQAHRVSLRSSAHRMFRQDKLPSRCAPNVSNRTVWEASNGPTKTLCLSVCLLSQNGV